MEDYNKTLKDGCAELRGMSAIGFYRQGTEKYFRELKQTLIRIMESSGLSNKLGEGVSPTARVTTDIGMRWLAA